MTTTPHQDAPQASTLLLSSDTTMTPAVALGLPKEHNGLPITYRWTQTTIGGNWIHPNTGATVTIDKPRVQNLAKNIKAAIARRVDIPISSTHKYHDPKNTMGGVFDARERDGELDLLTGYYGDDSFSVAQKNKVSLGLETDFKDSLGNKYSECISHLAVTPVPVLHGLPGFVTLSRGEPTEAEPLPLAPSQQEGVDMFDPALKGRVTQYLGDTATPEDTNKVISALLDKLDAAPKPDVIATLSTERDELKQKVQTLSREEPPADPRIATLNHRLAKAEIASLGLSKASQDALLGLVEVDGKPNAVLLSREDDGSSITLDRVIEVVKQLKPSLVQDEKTGIQTLSREVPDAVPPKPTIDATIEAGRKEGEAFMARFATAQK